MNESKASIKFIEKCYKLYEQKMYQVAYRILNNEGMAEDAVQDAFLKLMRANTYFEDVKSDDCKRYIITVIKHSSIDVYNKIKRDQNVVFFSEREDLFSELVDESSNHETEDIDEYIDNIPEKYKEVVECLIIKELSIKETAEKLKISEANVRKRFQRAKALIKTNMKGVNEDEQKRKWC